MALFGKSPYPSISLKQLEALHTQFLRAWLSQHYRKLEEEAHAENDARDEEEPR